MAQIFQFEPTGKIKQPSNTELLEMDKDNAIIAFSSGTMGDGRPYYAYIAVRPSLYKEFCALTKSKAPIVLRNYGDILAGGFAKEPPPEVIQRMRDEYGCDPEFENNLVKEALKQQDTFVKQREDNRIADIVSMLQNRQNNT